MKLSKLYSNRPNMFEPINFASGLNVVLGEIRLPENRNKDTHNLGKTTLGRLIDFCFLERAHKELFLLKHYNIFNEFVFFLEIKLIDGSYITVRRSIENPAKISFKKHILGNQNFSSMPDLDWDHFDMPFKRARKMLDGLLDLRALKPWSYRSEIGYLLRSQGDFSDVFQLRKFAGPHSTWKPFLAHILGFNGDLLTSYYEKEDKVNENKVIEQTIVKELGGDSIEDISKIEGILLLKQQDAEDKQKLLDNFDFAVQDKEKTENLVNDIDGRIATLNADRYSLNYNHKKIVASLKEDQILFNSDEAKRLFYEAGVLFEGQIKKDFDQLIAFNKAITSERRSYLEEERIDIETKLKKVDEELYTLGKQRSNILGFLGDTDVFNKYKRVSMEMVMLRTNIASLERQRDSLHRLQELRFNIRTLNDERSHIQTDIENDVKKQNTDKNSLFSSIRLFFNEIVEEVISKKALLSVSLNGSGHLEFNADILDESGNATSAGLGHTYRKLLCIAFDLAVLRANLDVNFPRFVFHDGVFESLDDRKKDNLLGVIRRYASLGIQSIITLIDSDMPVRREKDGPLFDDGEIVLILHDENEQGRLFKMRMW